MTSTAAQDAVATRTTHARAFLFRVTRADGAVLRFTDHNEQIPWGGETFRPVYGFDVSAIEQPEGPGEDLNASIRGILNSIAISKTDLRAGRYDGARVDVYLVDWRWPWACAPLVADSLWVSELTYDGYAWAADFVSLSRHLEAKIGDVYGRSCRWDIGEAFGDATRSGCKVDVDSMSFFGVAVTSVTDTQTFAMLGLPALVDHYFASGRGLWVTGDNVGIEFRTLQYAGGTRTFIIGDPMPFTIQVGDRANVYVGCDLTSDTCKARFDNFDNFGGFPFLDGQDRATKGVK